MSTTELWAVNIQGPDDIVACDDYVTAIRFANIFNAWWQARVEKHHHPYDPRLWAIPVIWENGTEDEHKAWVNSPSVDYAAFLEKARAGASS